MNRSIMGALSVLVGAAVFCLFITLYGLSKGSPLVLNDYWIPFIFGGVAGLIVEKWRFHQRNMENEFKNASATLEKNLKCRWILIFQPGLVRTKHLPNPFPNRNF